MTNRVGDTPKLRAGRFDARPCYRTSPDTVAGTDAQTPSPSKLCGERPGTAQLWTAAQTTFPGLAQYDLPDPPDPFIRRTLYAVRDGLERDVSMLAADLFRESGPERARTRRLLRRLIPQLREARRLAWAADVAVRLVVKELTDA